MKTWKNQRGVVEPISAIAVAGMVVMMGGMMAFMVWGMPKMMGMMHGQGGHAPEAESSDQDGRSEPRGGGGGHDDKQHEAASKEHDAHATKAVDPVCGMDVEVKDDTPRISLKGKTYYFCSEDDMKKFAAEPEKYATPGEKK